MDTPSDTAYAGPSRTARGRACSGVPGRGAEHCSWEDSGPVGSEAAAGMWLRAWDGVGSPTLETEPPYRHLPRDQLTLTGRQPQGEPTPEMAAPVHHRAERLLRMVLQTHACSGLCAARDRQRTPLPAGGPDPRLFIQGGVEPGWVLLRSPELWRPSPPLDAGQPAVLGQERQPPHACVCV